jgi:integrase/recombinase XerC
MLTLWYLVSKVLEEWGRGVPPLLAHLGSPALWPSERGARVVLQRINDWLGVQRARSAGGLGSHSLRRSYVIISSGDGWDAGLRVGTAYGDTVA